MPLEELSDDHLVHRCSGCGSARTLAHAVLETGADDTASVDPRVLALPACTVCGAHEFLVRSVDADREHAVPGSYSHLHRLLVDHLHERLEPRRAAAHGGKSKTKKPTKGGGAEALQRWFPNGLKLPQPDGFESAEAENGG